jgi:hypothetical protein
MNITDDCLIIKKPYTNDPIITLNLPAILSDLDKPNIKFLDIMELCKQYVPQLIGITDKFMENLKLLRIEKKEEILFYIDICRSSLLYDKFDGDNPGHLFVLILILGGIYGGIAREIYIKTLIEKTMNDYDKAIKTLLIIIKCFGACGRFPLVPHMPYGVPPTPISALVDILIHKYPCIEKNREALNSALFDWHVPKYIKEDLILKNKSYITIWDHWNQQERLSVILKYVQNHQRAKD